MFNLAERGEIACKKFGISLGVLCLGNKNLIKTALPRFRPVLWPLLRGRVPASLLSSDLTGLSFPVLDS